MMHIEYTLDGYGWATCTVSDGEKLIKITASYLSDPVQNLLRAMIQLMNGDKESHASFDEEPGEYRWIFNRLNGDNILIAIREFDDLWSNEPDEKGKKIFETISPLKDLVYAIYSMAEKILKDTGEEKYKELWGYTENGGSFPIDEYKKVHQWIKNR